MAITIVTIWICEECQFTWTGTDTNLMKWEESKNASPDLHEHWSYDFNGRLQCPKCTELEREKQKHD